MNTESNIPKERVLIEYSAETNAIVEQNMPDESDELKRETKALIEAIKTRAKMEAQGAGELTRDTYLTAVRQARETIEQNQIFDPERIEYNFKLMQMDAQKNWESLLEEVSIFGDRLSDAAKAAWDVLTAPRPDSKL
jgi:hypothetical protein